MTMLLASVRLELTTLALLAPSSDELSYRAPSEETPKFSIERMEKNEKYRNIFYIGNQVENISSIPQTGFSVKKDKSRTKLTSISFYFLRNIALD